MPYTDLEKLRESKRLAARTPKGKRRAWKASIKKNYGLSWEEFTQMILLAEGRCEICEEIPKRGLWIDHDHVTGRVRGLLCPTCNRGMHLFDKGLINKVEEYVLHCS